MLRLNKATTNNDHNPNKSFEVSEPPRDSVTSLSFSPTEDLLVATSWDNLVRCWRIDRNGPDGAGVTCAAVGQISHDKPVLCSAWRDDGAAVFSGGCNNQVKVWDLAAADFPAITVGFHDDAVKEVAWIPDINALVTGSWDRTLKYWDVRQPKPIHTRPLTGPCRALSVNYPLMVVGAGDTDVLIFDLQNLQTVLKASPPLLEYQTRCIATFPDNKGFLVGSIEGKVAVHHIDADKSENYSFRCHRQGLAKDEIYSVNSLSFHPRYHTFASTGSDGVCAFWDKDRKMRVQALEKCNQPIPCGTFNHDGSIFAYSSCYDWSKGAEHHNPATAKTYIFLHLPRENDLKAKPKPATVAEKGTTS